MAVIDVTSAGSVTLVRNSELDKLKLAVVTFNVSGTYADADGIAVKNVHTMISSATKNGRTVTPVSAGLWQPASKDSNNARFMGLRTFAISTNDVTCKITEGASDGAVPAATALGAGAVPAQNQPFGIIVAYTEA